MSRAALRASLALWRRRLAYRQRRLKVSVRHHRPNSARKWRGLVDEAHHKIARRERQLSRARPLRERALDVMLGWEREDVQETFANNRGPKVDAIIRKAGGTPGEPWCADGVMAAYLDAGAKTVQRAWAYVPTLERLLTRVVRPRPGHVVIFNFDGGVADHTGLFIRDNGDGTITTVECNTGTGGARMDGTGDGVHRRVRSKSMVQSYRRVRR